MKINLVSKVSGPDVACFMFEGQATPLGVAAATGKALLKTAGEEGFTGKAKELLVVYPSDKRPGQRVFLAGLGKPAAFTSEVLRQRVAAIGRTEASHPRLARAVRDRGAG